MTNWKETKKGIDDLKGREKEDLARILGIVAEELRKISAMLAEGSTAQSILEKVGPGTYTLTALDAATELWQKDNL